MVLPNKARVYRSRPPIEVERKSLNIDRPGRTDHAPKGPASATILLAPLRKWQGTCAARLN
jgi:hypothetical protein